MDGISNIQSPVGSRLHKLINVNILSMLKNISNAFTYRKIQRNLGFQAVESK